MKITFKGDYALKIIMDLAIGYPERLTQIKDIAKRQDIPKKFLEQIVTQLKGAQYIKTVRGPHGGVTLAKPPAQITLGEIIRLIEGPTSPIACVSTTGFKPCGFSAACVLREVFSEVKERINAVVDQTTFQMLADRAKQLSGQGGQDYFI